MRFMSLIRVDENTGQVPSQRLIDEMTVLIGEMRADGKLLDTGGLQPTAKGRRVRLHNGKLSKIDGPFAEAKEVVGGYWIWQCKSKEEAVEWARRAPMQPGDVVEVRRIFEMEDFAPSPEVDRAYEVLKGTM